MKTTIIIRGALVVSHLLLLKGLSGPVFELVGFGEYEMKGLTALGTSYLTYTLWVAVLAFLFMPLRFGYLISGLVLGGLGMIGLTVVRDAVELATMDTELPDLREILKLLWGGKLICWSCGLIVLADLAGLVLGEWRWKLRKDRGCGSAGSPGRSPRGEGPPTETRSAPLETGGKSEAGGEGGIPQGGQGG